MFFRRIIVLFLVLSLLISISSYPINPAVAEPTLPSTSLQSQNGFFTENKGQWNPEILFVGSTSFGKVAFLKNAILYKLIKTDGDSIQSQTKWNQRNQRNITVGSKKYKDKTFQSQAIKLSFINPSTPTIQGEVILPHYNNYFIGNDSKKWGIHCQNFAKICYTNIWSGIDLAYFFTPNGMKYEYYVKPEANIQNLQIKVEGAVLSNHRSSLQFETTLGNIQDSNLIVLDQRTGIQIYSSFSIQNNIIQFQDIPLNRINTVVIDPIIYSTYLGGSGNEGFNHGYTNDIAVDRFGNTYICGYTDSIDFPTQDPIQEENKDNLDAFITKLNKDGSNLIYSTYFGGKSTESSSSIAVDYDGYAYICGFTDSPDFPLKNPIQKFTKGWDAFVIKMNGDGTELFYSTCLGGKDYDYAYGIAADRDGNAYITGVTESPTFPTKDAFQSVKSSVEDAFVTKLNTDGSDFVFSTFLGGDNYDQAYSIAVDPNNNVYICGATLSSDFPLKDPIQSKKKENFDGFVTKLNTKGDELVYSTYIGGSKIDRVYSIAVDPISTDLYGCTYICGITYSADFPTKNPLIKGIKGGQDAFVAKLNSKGSSFNYSTFLGGGGFDQAYGIATDPIAYTDDGEPYCTGMAYITGMTNSTDFPTKYPLQLKGDNFDAFVTKINKQGTGFLFSTFLGGNNIDRSFGIVIDSIRNIYLCGYTYSSNFPTRRAYQNKLKGLQDAFVTKLSLPF